jgi:hypothetical protein
MIRFVKTAFPTISQYFTHLLMKSKRATEEIKPVINLNLMPQNAARHMDFTAWRSAKINPQTIKDPAHR